MARVSKKVKQKQALKQKGKTKKAVKTVRQPLDGVDYSRIYGAVCPACKMPYGQVRNTLPWEDKARIRYHICRRCGTKFKSVEIL